MYGGGGAGGGGYNYQQGYSNQQPQPVFVPDCYYDTMSDMWREAFDRIDWGDDILQCIVMDSIECKVKDWVMKLSYDEYVAEMKSNKGVSEEEFYKKYLWQEDDVVETLNEMLIIEPVNNHEDKQENIWCEHEECLEETEPFRTEEELFNHTCKCHLSEDKCSYDL